MLLEQARRVGELAQRRRLAACALQLRERLGARTRDLAEGALELATDDHVLHGRVEHLEADRRQTLAHGVHEALGQRRAVREQLLELEQRHGVAQRELRIGVHAALEVGDRVARTQRVDHAVAQEQRELRRHAVAREHLLARDAGERLAQVETTQDQVAEEEAVHPGREPAEVAAVLVREHGLVRVHDDARDERAQEQPDDADEGEEQDERAEVDAEHGFPHSMKAIAPPGPRRRGGGSLGRRPLGPAGRPLAREERPRGVTDRSPSPGGRGAMRGTGPADCRSAAASRWTRSSSWRGRCQGRWPPRGTLLTPESTGLCGGRWRRRRGSPTVAGSARSIG